MSRRKGYWPDTPREAHQMASAIGRDAANAQMRAAGRTAWNRDDANRAAEATQEMYRVFGILNADAWMPDGWMWAPDGTGNLSPVRIH